MHLAEFNRGILRHDWDDPRVADFVDNVDRVNALAMRSPGFVWMLREDRMDAEQRDPGGLLGGDPRTASTLSVWQDAESLRHFVWNTVHRAFFDRRAEWFEPGQGLRLVLWWVPSGHRPSIDEAVERFDHLTENGPTDFAFDWSFLARRVTAGNDQEPATTSKRTAR